MHALHLNYHEVTKDPRVLKQCNSLAERGVRVSVICALESGFAASEQVGLLDVHRIPWLSFENLSQSYLDAISEFPRAESLAKERLEPLLASIETLQNIRTLLSDKGTWLDPETNYRQYIGLKRLIFKLIFLRKRNALMRYVEKELGVDKVKAGLSSRAKFSFAVGNPGQALIADLSEVYQASAFLFDLNAQDLNLDGEVDVVHAHDIYTLVAGIRLAKALNAKVVYDAHEFEPGRASKMPSEGNALADAIELDCLEHADALITVSEGICRLYEPRFSKRAPVLVMNTPDINDPTPHENELRAQKKAFRKKLQLGDDTPLLIFTGLVLGDQRGLPKVAQALRSLPEMHLVILGVRDVRMDARLMKRAKKLGVADRIHMLPPVDHSEVVATIRACDVSVIPIQDASLSYRYSMPNKLFEGVFAGLPVAVSDLPDMKAFVEQFGIGAVMDSSDPASIARTIEMLYSEGDAYRLPHEAFEEFIAAHSWSAQVDRLYDLYQDLTMDDNAGVVASRS